jgi:hypothetical protein
MVDGRAAGRRPVVSLLQIPGRRGACALPGKITPSRSAPASPHGRTPRRAPVETAAALVNATVAVEHAVVEERHDARGRAVGGEPATVASTSTIRA